VQLSKWWITKTGKEFVLNTRPSVDLIHGNIRFDANQLIFNGLKDRKFESYFSKKL
jgi:hypothetical protein